MLKEKNVKSEIVFEHKEKIKNIELIYEDKKFVVHDIPDDQPLFKYLNDSIVKQNAKKVITQKTVINDKLYVQPVQPKQGNNLSKPVKK